MSLYAKDIMTPNPICVTPSTLISDAAKIMLDNHFNGLPVVDDEGMLVGVICQSDLIEQQRRINLPSFFILFDAIIPLELPGKYEESLKRITATKVEDAMRTKVQSLELDTEMNKIATFMLDQKYYSLPVTKNGKLVGIVGKEDMLRLLIK